MNKNVITAITLLLLTTGVAAQEPDFDTIAYNIVTQTAEVKPGEVVLIRGSVEGLEIFEALVAQTIIAGGQPISFLDFPQANNKAMREAPLGLFETRTLSGTVSFRKCGRVHRSDPGFNPVEFLARDIPRERLMAAQQGRASLSEAASAGSWRSVFVGQSSGIPTPSYADFSKADFEDMDNIFWQALSVTPDQLDSISSRITDAITPGADIHLTGPHDTDLRFTLSVEPVTITVGKFSDKKSSESEPPQVFLPAGEIAACVDPSSANGKLYIPMYTLRAQDITGITMIFKDGLITDINAESGGDQLREFFDSFDGPTRALSLINIGLNPQSRISSGSSYRSWEMGGVVTAFFGDNTIYQCGHVADNRLHPHIEGLTLTADGKPVVINGLVQ